MSNDPYSDIDAYVDSIREKAKKRMMWFFTGGVVFGAFLDFILTKFFTWVGGLIP